MAARRLLILMLVLLGVSTIAAALVPVDREALDDESSTTSTVTRPAPTGDLLQKRIDAGARTPTVVRAEVGDQLELRVISPKKADEVEIPALDELEDVDPDAPARFDLLLFDQGRFAVRLVESDRRIGELVVNRPKQPPKKSKR